LILKNKDYYMKSKNLKKDKAMIDKLKDNLASIAALIAAVAAIGGGFVWFHL